MKADISQIIEECWAMGHPPERAMRELERFQIYKTEKDIQKEYDQLTRLMEEYYETQREMWQ